MAVFENFPYTNVHELNLNWLVDQMKSLLDEWDAFTTSVDATAQSGSVAGVEVIGSLKEGLTFKFTLPKGDKGDMGNTGNGISSVTFNPNYSLTFNFTDGTSYTTPSLRGAQGEGLKINDTYPTLQDLKTAHPTGVEGDAYLIGTDPNFTLYIWSTRLNDYAMVGALTSPQPSSTTPLMDGVADNGSEFAYARGDHRHPSDTSKVDVTTFNQSIQDVIDDINTINGTIQTIEGNVSANASNITSLQNSKQNNLTAGAGIDLVGNTISSKTNMDLLWTNSNPSGTMSAQRIPLNISNYSLILINFRITNANEITVPFLTDARTTTRTSAFSNWAGVQVFRVVIVSSDAITFDDGKYYPAYQASQNPTTTNGYMVPVSIYGIK